MLILSFNQLEMVNNNHEFYMRAALEEAKKAYARDEVPVGAVIVCNETIIAKAHNLVETLKDPTAHAEMQAITAATNWLGGKYLTDCTLYVTIEPCAMCAAALGWSQVSSVVYGSPDEKKGYSTISPALLHPKAKVESGILQKECSELVVRFFKAKRKA